MSLRQGLIGGWCPSLGPTAFSLLDRARSNNPGALAGFTATDWASDGGKIALLLGANKSISFVSDRITIAGDFSISFWARPTTQLTANRTVMQKQSGGLSLILLNDTVFSARSQTTGVVTWAIPSIGIAWTHFAVIRSGSSARVWANGVESTDGAKAFGGGFVVDCLGSVISPSITFPGYLDDVLVYDRAITISELASLRLERGIVYKQQRRTRYASVRRFRRRQYAQLVGGGIV